MPTSDQRDVYVVRSASALGRALRAVRQSRSLTQSELAEVSRTNRFSIIQLENGEATRAIEKLFDTLAALELELVVRPRSGRRAGPDG